jgi:hypothetical protein
MAILIPCLVALRSEFNALNPERDKGADGWIGDAAHQARPSDHNPDAQGRVHAVDIDSTGPWPNYTFDIYVRNVIAGERDKWLNPNDVCRLEYIIWDHEIFSRSNDFEPRDYKGSDPHTNHAHFSGRRLDKARADTRPFLQEEDMTVDEFANALADLDSKLAKRMRAIGWQYVGGGIPEGMNTLGVLNEILGKVRSIDARLTVLESKK